MAENFPTVNSEKGEDERSNKLSRIQKMLAHLLGREGKLDAEVTEDNISAKSSIQFISSSAIFGSQSDDDDE